MVGEGADIELGVRRSTDQFAAEGEEVLEAERGSDGRTKADGVIGRVGTFGSIAAEETFASVLGGLEEALTRVIAPREASNGGGARSELPLFGGGEVSADPGAEGLSLRGRDAGDGSGVGVREEEGAGGHVVGRSTGPMFMVGWLTDSGIDAGLVLGNGGGELLDGEGGEGLGFAEGAASEPCGELSTLDGDGFGFGTECGRGRRRRGGLGATEEQGNEKETGSKPSPQERGRREGRLIIVQSVQ